MNDLHPQSGRPFSIEAYTDAFQDAANRSQSVDKGLAHDEIIDAVEKEMERKDGEYGAFTDDDERIFIELVRLGAEHGLRLV